MNISSLYICKDRFCVLSHRSAQICMCVCVCMYTESRKKQGMLVWETNRIKNRQEKDWNFKSKQNLS